MFEISRPAAKLITFLGLNRGLTLALILLHSLAFSNCALSQDGQIPTVHDHDIEIVESPFTQPPAMSQSSLAWPGALGQSLRGLGLGYHGLGAFRQSSIPYVGVPHVGVPYVGIPYVGSLSSIGGLIGHSSWSRGSWSDPYRIYRTGSSFGGYGGYGGYGGLGQGFNTGFGSSYSSAYSWARPFGRLSNQGFIQTAPSKAAGNYYAPATADPTAAGSYYANNHSTPKPRNQVFDKDYNDYSGSNSGYIRSKAASYGNSDHTKPQKNYWGGSGSPFPKDLNSTPWSK